MNTDPIADLLTRIRNAQLAGKSYTHAPYSKIKEDVCKVMKRGKFISGYTVDKSGKFQELNIEFSEKYPTLELKRVSRPGQRIYLGKNELPRIKNGMGIAIVSTPQGVISSLDAKKKGIGGEVLCSVS